MLIYEVICKSYDRRYVLFRTKDQLKAESFCAVYNKYHNNIFDEGAIIKIIDTARMERDADELLKKFKFMTEVQILDGEIVSCKPVFVNDERIKLNDAISSLSEGVKLFFDIKDDLDEDKIWNRYEIFKKELAAREKNNSDTVDNAGISD